MRFAIVAILLAFATTRVHADDNVDEKSALAAESMSLAPSVLGMLLFVATESNAADDSPSTQKSNLGFPMLLLTAGPSLGHLYTHSYGIAALGAAVRLAGVYMIYDGKGHCDSSRGLDDLGDCYVTGTDQHEQNVGATIVLLAAAAQLIDAPLSAQRYNSEHAHTVIVPTAAPGRIGLAIAGTF